MKLSRLLIAVTIVATVGSAAPPPALASDREPTDDAPDRPELVTEFLEPGFMETGRLESDDDVDVYGVVIEEAGEYTVQLVGLQHDLDLELLDESGGLIGFSALRGSRSQKIEGELPAGTYYLRIYGYPVEAHSSGGYILEVLATG